MVTKLPDDECKVGITDLEATSDDIMEEDSPYEIVRISVSNKDDPTMPTFTFRMWLLGTIFCCGMSFVNQFYWFRENQLTLTAPVVQILSFPLGYLLARILPTRIFRTFGFEWTLNPGPFNIKEHTLLTILASACTKTAYSMDVVVIKKVMFKGDLGFGQSYLLLLTSQMLGYSFAGFARKLLVYPAAMLWPEILITATLFRTLHEGTYWGRWSRTRVFWLAFSVSFVWYFVPGYLFTILSALPILCIAGKHNVIMQQLGDTSYGLGILNLTLDWSTIASFLGSPIGFPWVMACNCFAGFVVFAWIIAPAGYYTNTWGSGLFPIYSSSLFLANGTKYDFSKVMTPQQMLDTEKYAEYGPLRMGFMYIVDYGVGFAAITALFSYVILNYGKDIVQRVRQSQSSDEDIHMKLMRKYPEVPVWWYVVIFVVMAALAIVACEVFNLLPWTWFVVSVCVPLAFTLPSGIVQAISNRQIRINLISELVIGYGRPGDPMGNVTFKVYSFMAMFQALNLLSDQKLGHYMKIPPRHMFWAQIAGTVIATTVQLGTAYWLMNTVENLCTQEGYPWTCRNANAFFSASIIWGLVGPRRMFGEGSPYSPLLYLFLVGVLLPVPIWLMSRRYPGSVWSRIHIPVILSIIGSMPPLLTGTMVNWFIAAFFLVFLWRRWYITSWQRYAFATSAGLDAGVAISGIIIYAISQNARAPQWYGTNNNLCPLARSGGYLTHRP